MLYRLRTKLAKRRFSGRISKILETPSIDFAPAGLTILSMVSHDDLLMYLLAIKSFCRRLGKGNIVIVDDGSMTVSDKNILEIHLREPTIIERKSIVLGRFPRHIMWERLAHALDLSAEEYVIQLDADTLTRGPVDEILDCVAANRAFTLGTWNGQKVVSVSQASAYADAIQSRDHIQVVSEKALTKLNGARDLKYVRGSAGLAGLARGGFSREHVENFYGQMTGMIGERFHEWGTDQVAFNFIVANSAGAMVLPYPAYACVGPELDVEQARFLHFIGTYRFTGGVYAREGHRVITSLAIGG